MLRLTTAHAEDRASLEADLEVSLRLSTETAVIGEEVTVIIEVYNRGPRTPEGVVVHYRLPEGLTFLGAVFSDPSDSYNPTTGAWQVGVFPHDILMPVPTMRLEVTVRVMETGTTEHIAEVVQSSRPDPDSEPGNANAAEDDYASALLTAEVAGVLDLRLTTDDGDVRAVPGEQLTYALSYVNAGLAATGVVLTETLPAHTTFDAANSTPGWTAVGGDQYKLALGNLEAGTSGLVAFTVVVDASIPGTVVEITNTATITDDGSQGEDATPDDNSATIETPLAHPAEADLSLLLSASHTNPLVGEEVDLVIELANAGPAQATGVAVTVSLPEGVQLLAYDDSFEPTSGLWSLGAMSAGTQVTLHLTIEVLTAESLDIVAVISTSDQVDPDSVPGEIGTGEDDEAEVVVLGRLGETMLTGPMNGSQVSASSVDLRWEAVPGAWQYEVEVALAGTDFTAPIFSNLVETTSAQVEDLEGETNYAWRVRAVAVEVVGPWSQVGVFTVEDNPVGIEDRAVPGVGHRLSAAYPNPFTSKTTVHLAVAQRQQIRVEVFDMLGRRVEVLYQDVLPAQRSSLFQWDATEWPSGLYLIRVVGKHFVETRRVAFIK